MNALGCANLCARIANAWRAGTKMASNYVTALGAGIALLPDLAPQYWPDIRDALPEHAQTRIIAALALIAILVRIRKHFVAPDSTLKDHA